MSRKLLITSALSLLLLAPTATASEIETPEGYKNFPTDVNFSWKPESNSVSVMMSTGCRSAHRGGNPLENFRVEFDHNMRRLEINGSYIVKPQPSGINRIGPHDCMGSRHKSFEFLNVEKGPLTVTRDGQTVWSLKLTGEIEKHRLNGRYSFIRK